MTTSSNPFTSRIHVILARESPTAVVIRHGRKSTCTLGWNLLDDTLAMGQWLKGRIFSDRSDLSPDGKHFIYSATNGKYQSKSRGNWTALSYAPYIKAVVFWPGSDYSWHGCRYGGGGLFIDNHRVCLNGYSKLTAIDSGEVRISTEIEFVNDWPDFPNVEIDLESVNSNGFTSNGFNIDFYSRRLFRAGWQIAEIKCISHWHQVGVWEKRLNNHWLLRKFPYSAIDHPQGKNTYDDEHQLVNRESGEEIDGKAWEWADFDKDGKRLLWAQDGKIFARSIKKNLGEVKELFDLNPMTFETIVAPY